MDRVVTGSYGMIITKTDLLNVYGAFDTSIIKSIDVRAGDEVKKGQVLATLDPTLANADVAQFKLQMASAEAQIARDEAELANRPLRFRETADPDFLKNQIIQRDYYAQHVGQYKAQIDSFDARIAQYKATIKKYQVDLQGYKAREDVNRKIEELWKTLAGNGFGSQLNMYTSLDTRMELTRQVEYDRNSVAEAEQTLASTQADRETFIEQWNASLSQDLVTQRGIYDNAKASYDKAIKHQDLVQLTALDDSSVLSIAQFSVGSVLTAGTTLLTLTPLRVPLEAEVWVLASDIGFSRVGDRCVLKIDAFDYTQHGTAEGTVRWISEGSYTTDQNNQPTAPYFKIHCSVEKYNFRGVPQNFRLVPGMTLTGDLMAGTRSVIGYLFSGVLHAYYQAMREPN
jgi:hemolysin D